MVGWYSPGMWPAYVHPKSGRLVLVWLVMRDNPPAQNAPGKFSFGHWIDGGDNPHWPEDGWFVQDADYWRVEGWWSLPDEPTPR